MVVETENQRLQELAHAILSGRLLEGDGRVLVCSFSNGIPVEALCRVKARDMPIHPHSCVVGRARRT